MKTRVALTVVAAVLSGLCAGACDGGPPGPDDAPRGSSDVVDARSAIVDGIPEPGRPAVVAIVLGHTGTDQLICSGVLITPTIVVTAAHCLHPQVLGVHADELTVVFGPSVAAADTRIEVEHGAYHPSWRLDDPEAANDIGALRLAGPAPVDPIPLGSSPAEGDEVVLVGFGDTQRNTVTSTGVKRSGDAVIAEIAPSWFRMDRSPSTTCSGDSGGATLSEVDGVEVLLGVHSRGDCESTVWNERVDVHASGFLKAFMGEFGGCGQDGACALNCPDPDPDCPCASDSTCNEACGATGPDSTDPDCAAEDACAEDDASCACAGGDCQTADAPPPRGSWGSSGCTVGAAERGDGSNGTGAAAAAVAAGLLVLGARRRRSRRA